MQTMVSEIRAHLTDHIIPFWNGLRDDAHGGFIGLVDSQLVRHPDADKGCILNSRILWFYSESYLLLKDGALLDMAAHAYRMLNRMVDDVHGGVYWSVTYDGRPSDTTKHTYNQAFAVYALSAYYRASGDESALKLAEKIFDVIEEKCFDGDGYLEAFTRDWQPESNEKLSENGVIAHRTMNTLLHVLEGYTGLYQANGSDNVREKLMAILSIWQKHIYNDVKKRQEVFFDAEYHSLIDLTSYGHDIETSWLADRTLEILDDAELTASIRPKLMDMAEALWQQALTGQGFINECEKKGVDDTDRIWWVQAEALVGFLNAWQKTGQEKYLDAVRSQWRYIRESIIDKRAGSEWLWLVHEDGTTDEHDMVDEWKCPYHNGRMAMELIARGRVAINN